MSSDMAITVLHTMRTLAGETERPKDRLEWEKEVETILCRRLLTRDINNVDGS